MIKLIKCSVFDSYASIIAHQVNCMGVMGSGVAAQVKKRYPEAYQAYKDFCTAHKGDRRGMLGTAQLCPVSWLPDGTPRIFIANLFAQFDYGREPGKVYTNYTALRHSLETLAMHASENNYYVALPDGIGCGRGGGDWDEIVLPMIEQIFDEHNANALICKI